MPSLLEYWSLMPYTTSYGYLHRYQTIEKILEGIIRHASEKNIAIWAEPGEQVNLEILKANCNQQRKKRILSQKEKTPIKRQRLNEKEVLNTTDVVENNMPDFTDRIAPDFTDIIVPDFTDTIVPDLTDTKQVPISIATSTPPTPIFNGVHKPLVLNGLVIEVDPDTFMVDATQMCKAAKKRWNDYQENSKSTAYIYALESNTGIPVFDLIRSKPGHNGGTMVHLLIALDLASWLSPEVKLQFNMWNAELLLTGRVELGNEMNVQQLAPSAPSCCTNTNGAEIIEFVLKLSNGADFIVPVRRDGYVNVTKICQAAGKRLQHYKDRAENKHFLDRFVVLTRIQASTLFEANEGNCANRGTFAHPDIAIHIAQWCSADFSIQVSRWVRQLMTTGRVELGKEMNVQQLEEAWERTIQERQDRASADLNAEQDRCRKLELRLATIQDAHKQSDEEKKALKAIKAREDLEAAIRFQVETTAPMIASYKEGDNVLYMARVDETKFKYGHTKNLKQRLEAHGRPGVYPTFELVWVVKSNNGVASEDKMRDYVKKKKIIAEYGTQREVISLESVNDLERLLKKMNKCALSRADSDIDMKRLDIKMKKIDADSSIEIKKIDADVEKIKAGVDMKRMDLEAKWIKMLEDKTITFEQYLQIKN